MTLRDIVTAEDRIFDDAKKKVVQIAQEVLQTVPAYPRFLSDQGCSVREICSFSDFTQLPFQTKQNYVIPYDLRSRCLGGTLDRKHVIFSSSGSTGVPQYWCIRPEDEKEFPAIYNKMLQISLDYENKSCLVVICLGLGSWVSGLQTHWALRQAGIENNGAFSVATPGIDFDSTIRFITELGPYYDKIFLISYPGMVRTLFESAAQRGITLEDYNIRLGLVGDNFPETWRGYMEKKLRIDPDKEPMGIWGGYGSADIGGVGIESPLSIAIRKAAMENAAFKEEVFGKHGDMPFLCRYNPAAIFVECAEGELIFSKMKAVPLLRYRISDSGGIIRFSEMLSLLERHSIPIESMPSDELLYPAPLPFIFTYGKSHGDIVLSGVNIYSSHIREMISDKKWSSFLTGRFLMGKYHTEDFGEIFSIHVELVSGIRTVDIDRMELSREFQAHLRVISSEYNALCSMTESPEEYLPEVTALPFGHEKFSGNTYKSVYLDKGSD